MGLPTTRANPYAPYRTLVLGLKHALQTLAQILPRTAVHESRAVHLSLSMPCRVCHSIAGRLHLPRTAAQQELEHLESELSDMDISLYRWWAWANHYRVRSQVRDIVA